MSKHHQILVIGAGNAGLSVAAQLLIKRPNLDIAIIDPSDKHYYQPAWTLVGGGAFDIKKTEHDQAKYIPKQAKWIKEAVDTLDPDNNALTTTAGNTYTYDILVAAPGIQLNWDLIEGLPETLGKNGVTSNYRFDLAPYTWELVKNFKGGKALFTNPSTPIKCGGAPQKIMYLASDRFRKNGVLKDSNVEFCSAGGVIFGVKKYAETLLKVVDRYGIQLNFKHDLMTIDGPNKKAVFKVTDAEGNSSLVTKEFDMIHVTPPQSAPDFIRESPLAVGYQDQINAQCAGGDKPGSVSVFASLVHPLGWIDVDKHSLQHNHYPNVFSLGDAANTPNAKTGAAIRKQAPVVVANLLSFLDKQALTAQYNGYGSCPLVTGYNKLVLAEFDYNNEPVETFPFNQAKERYSMWLLKKEVLPRLYWKKILTGKA